MRIAILFSLLLVSTAQVTESQQGTTVHGYAFARKPLVSPDDLADCINRQCLRVSAQEILQMKSFRKRHPSITTQDSLVSFVRSLVSVACPTKDSLTLARLITSPERLLDDAGWRRPCREGEVFFSDNNTGLVEFSGWCGNFVPEEISFRKPESPAPLPEPAKMSAVSPKVDTLVLDTLPVTRFEVIVYASRVDSIKVVKSEENQFKLDAGQGLVKLDHTEAFFKVVERREEKKKEKTSLVPVLTHTAAAALGALGGYLLGPRQTQNVTVGGESCGPVNPPNAPTFGIMRALGEPPFAKRERLLKFGIIISF